jgi:hypothetical protein
MMLRTAVSALKSKYELRSHRLSDIVDMALKNIEKPKKFARPPASSDRVYRSDITHPSYYPLRRLATDELWRISWRT